MGHLPDRVGHVEAKEFVKCGELVRAIVVSVVIDFLITGAGVHYQYVALAAFHFCMVTCDTV